MSDVEYALLGAVLGFLQALMVLLMSEPGRIVELAAASMRPLLPAQLQSVTQSMRCRPEQLREVLWVSALYQDLRKTHGEEQTILEWQVWQVLSTMMQTGQPATAGAQSESPAAHGQRAEVPTTSSSSSSGSGGGEGGGGRRASSPEGSLLTPGGGSVDDGPDPEMLRQLCMQLQERARLNFWWEVLQMSHVAGLLSLRQVRTGKCVTQGGAGGREGTCCPCAG
jgi:hypothetical protein